MHNLKKILSDFKAFFELKRLKKTIIRLIHYTFVPFCLSLLFVWQNLEFNNLLEIFPGQHFIRRGLVTFALGAIIFGPSLFLKRTGRHIYLFFACTFVSSVFISEFIYYKYSGAFLQASAIKYFGLAITQTKTITSLITISLFFFLVNFIFWLIDLYSFSSFDKNHKNLNFKEKLLAIIFMACIVWVGYGHLIKVEAKEWGHTEFLYKKIFDYDNYVSKVGVVNFFLQDASKIIFNQNKVTSSDIKFLKQWLNQNNHLKNNPLYFKQAANKNLIMIQIESLDGVLINKIVNNQEITPNLNRLTKDGIYFSNYYAQFGLGTTADAEFSIFNSLYPLPEDVAFERYAKNDYLALPEILERNGYKTFSFHGDVPSFWNRANIYPKLGFTNWFSRQDYTSNNPLGGAFELSDQDFFEQTSEKLLELPQPFAAILMTLSLHTPFIIPNEKKVLDLEQETILDQTQKNYLHAAFYTDKVLGEFIDSLKNSGLYEKSLILIYGDHGSYTDIEKVFGEQSLVQNNLNNNRVPLIILNSGIEPKKDYTNQPTSHLDLYPTIANLLGLETGINLLGQDIFNTTEPVVVKRKNISGQIKTILTDKYLFIASENGEFEKGICYSLTEAKNSAIQNCREIYEKQNKKIIASDIIIRANLAGWLEDNHKR